MMLEALRNTSIIFPYWFIASRNGLIRAMFCIFFFPFWSRSMFLIVSSTSLKSTHWNCANSFFERPFLKLLNASSKILEPGGGGIAGVPEDGSGGGTVGTDCMGGWYGCTIRSRFGSDLLKSWCQYIYVYIKWVIVNIPRWGECRRGLVNLSWQQHWNVVVDYWCRAGGSFGNSAKRGATR